MRLRIYTLLVLFSCTITTSGHAFECTVCHSKNPAMVKMHTALQGQGCFGCHTMGAKLMGKGQPKDRESLLKRRQSEEICLPCHTAATGQKEVSRGTDSTHH